MRRLRYTIDGIKEGGVKVEMLFTPHLYSFKGLHGITFEADSSNQRQVFEVYADIMYCAALNAWVLDKDGDPDAFPYTRGDFHAWMTAEPRAYGKALQAAIEALTGKTLREVISSPPGGEQTAENGENADNPADGSKKKVRTSWIGRLLRRSSSGRAE